jgi:aminopeptidase YwaD
VNIEVDRERLCRILKTTVGERSPSSGRHHLAVVEDLVENEFGNCGLMVENDFFTYRGTSYRNIVGRLGGLHDEAPIILGAHIDSVEGTSGADDNASGVAVLLEAARILSQADIQLPLLFCAFNLEELNMIGSTAFAKKLKAAGKKLTAMISLEMVGYTDPRPGSQKLPAGLSRFYPDRGDFIGVVGN